MKNFSDKNISLHDTGCLYSEVEKGINPGSPPVLKDNYLESVKRSKWYGPYGKSTGWHVFVGLTDHGDNPYIATVIIDHLNAPGDS